MTPTVQKAIVVQQDGSVALRQIDVPKPGPDEILIKVVAAAQNPTDWKSAWHARRAGTISGCDFSGIVEEIGSNVPHGLRSIGERVAGLVQGGIRNYGAFSEYLITDAGLVVHVPDTWSFEDAAQLGIAPFTALRTLYDMLQLPLPPLEPTASAAAAAANPPQKSRIPILVGGGATSVGQYVVQFAKLSGLYVIATASEKNFSLVRSLGADVVVDYRDPVAAAKQIRKAAPNLQYATDCAIDGTSPAIVAASLAGQGTLAHITTLPYPQTEGIRILSSVVFDFLGKDSDFPRPFTAKSEVKEKGRQWAKFLSDLLVKADIRPNPVLLQPRGLASVPDGFQYMREGKVSAQKIVYRIADTPKE